MACCTRAVSLLAPTCAPKSVSATMVSVRRFISRDRSSGTPGCHSSRMATAARTIASV